jgi:hypothetical protein
MPLSELLPWVTGAGGALAVLLLVQTLFVADKIMPTSRHKQTVADKDKQIELLAAAVDRERVRGDAGVLAASTTRDILQALHREAAESR